MLIMYVSACTFKTIIITVHYMLAYTVVTDEINLYSVGIRCGFDLD